MIILTKELRLEYDKILKVERPYTPFRKSTPYNANDIVYISHSYNSDNESNELETELYRINEVGYYLSGEDFAIPIYNVEQVKNNKIGRQMQTPYAIWLKSIVDRLLNNQQEHHKPIQLSIFDL
jgi:hypothetical protein